MLPTIAWRLHCFIWLHLLWEVEVGKDEELRYESSSFSWGDQGNVKEGLESSWGGNGTYGAPCWAHWHCGPCMLMDRLMDELPFIFEDVFTSSSEKCWWILLWWLTYSNAGGERAPTSRRWSGQSCLSRQPWNLISRTISGPGPKRPLCVLSRFAMSDSGT